MSETAFVVGAYASLPQTREEQEKYYAMWRDTAWASGLELPYPGDLRDNSDWLLSQFSADWAYNTITAIPGTMQSVGRDPKFGLASPDADGRVAALEFTEQIRQRVQQWAEQTSRPVVRYVQLHSAPTNLADQNAFARSLEALLERDWSGAQLVIEHCDAPRAGRGPEKGFLELADEVSVAKKVGVGIHLNWGRSCLEERTPEAVVEHIQCAGEAGVLRGLLFSGAGPEATQYGYEWIDGHLPHQADEPSSLLTDMQIRRCLETAQPFGVDYLGAKICVPKDASLQQRFEMVKHIYDATL